MAGEMSVWMQVVWGMVAVLVLFMFWPGVKAAMQKSEQAENKDWMGVMVPIAAVVLFIVFLIMMVRS